MLVLGRGMQIGCDDVARLDEIYAETNFTKHDRLGQAQNGIVFREFCLSQSMAFPIGRASNNNRLCLVRYSSLSSLISTYDDSPPQGPGPRGVSTRFRRKGTSRFYKIPDSKSKRCDLLRIQHHQRTCAWLEPDGVICHAFCNAVRALCGDLLITFGKRLSGKFQAFPELGKETSPEHPHLFRTQLRLPSTRPCSSSA
jgi:hypothetical protein